MEEAGRSLKWRLRTAAGVLLFALVTGAAVHVFRADSAHLTLYNSDSAIPVLMANYRGLTWFDAYYWGQDRFGALPFLLARAAAIGGFFWSPQSMQIYLIAWLAAAAGLFSRLFAEMRPAAALIFAAGALSVPFFRVHLFEIAQFFPWQLAPLFAAMLALRDLCSQATVRGSLLSGVLVFLAVWASAMNLIFLCTFALGELAAGSSGQRTRGTAVAALALAAGSAAEYCLRSIYHGYALSRYGNEFRTMSWVNRREIPGAVSQMLERLAAEPGLLLVDAAGLAALLYVVWAFWKKKEIPPSLRTAFALGAAGLLQLPVIVSVHHFVVSGYPPRFLFLFHAGLGCSAVCTSFYLLNHFAGSRFSGFPFQTAVCAALLCWIFVTLPARKEHPEFRALRSEARAVCESSADLLLGSYWQVYRTASLEEQCPSPLPHNGVNRIPWVKLKGKAVLIESSDSAETQEGSVRTYLNVSIVQTGPWQTIGGMKTASFSPDSRSLP